MNPVETERRILITGASQGIGRGIAEHLLSTDKTTRLALCARTPGLLEELAGENSIVMSLDLSNRLQARRFIDRAAETMGAIDILILNAAHHGVAAADETPEEALTRRQTVYSLNEVAQTIMIDRALPPLRASGGAVLFLTTGLAGLPEVPPGAEEYAASKHVIERYIGQIAQDPKNRNVFFFMVNPGPVDTAMHRFLSGSAPEPLASMSKTFREKGMLANPRTVGYVIGKMALTRCIFNPASNEYDIPIVRGSIIPISQESLQNASLSIK